MKYTALLPITIMPGTVVGMDDAQAFRRRALVKPVAKAKGYYEATSAFQFKAGEAFEVENELPKSMVETVDSKGAAAKAEHAESKPAAKTAHR